MFVLRLILFGLIWSYGSKIFLFSVLTVRWKCLQACYARVLDYRRKFIEAAVRYNELSYKTMIADEERMTALKNAMIGTILASAGMYTVMQKGDYKFQ